MVCSTVAVFICGVFRCGAWGVSVNKITGNFCPQAQGPTRLASPSLPPLSLVFLSLIASSSRTTKKYEETVEVAHVETQRGRE